MMAPNVVHVNEISEAHGRKYEVNKFIMDGF